MNVPEWTNIQATVIVPRKRDDVVVEWIDDEAIICDPVNGCTFHFNATALEVWSQCDGQRTTQELAEEMTQLYDVAFELALDDVEQLVVLFTECGLFDVNNIE